MSETKKENLWQRINRNIRYCISGVWNDTRGLWSVKTLKIINLSIHSFLDRDLQLRAAALTYYTVLAIVPALAMLFAIARGFGFQNLIQSELFRFFPAQREALENALTYVENYLAQSSQGVFIGIGIVLLLWTLNSLMSNVEDTFNHVWHVKTKRSLQRKFIDYTAMFLLLPVMMICSSGISIFMSDAVQRVFEDNNVISPMMHRLLSFTPTVITWLAFTAAFHMIPNTKVRFKNALVAGVLCGTVFQIVQWLFVSGQLYVSKYNAIYGSFAFLPLLLVWLQLSWLIALAGVGLTYSWQNYGNHSALDKVKDMSQTSANNLAIAALALAVKRFKRHEGALKRSELIKEYDIPGPLADQLLTTLQQAGLLNKVSTANGEDEEDRTDPAFQPTTDPDDYTVNGVANRLADIGNSDYIQNPDSPIADMLEAIASQRENQQQAVPDIRLLDLP